ncbi:alkaline phosphatase family protein [Pseudalkalibacillus decolorationis]|uniref:alkaline phosphatase family protein n=1 Tax=Pseudalkalibacillus decolorationis TaxID=163879 RepID=UPI0027E38001|nr:alkaline phosphatase family protein [Pseudalkalibacillus decolorationis]
MKILIRTIIIIALIMLAIWYGLSTPTEDLSKRTIKKASKPVILLVVDSLMDEPLQKAIKEGKAPALKFLMDHGQYYPDIVSSYPTMSVTIDSTLLTGTYANQHKVPGLVWFKEDENRLINYGSGKGEVVRLGVKQVLMDSLFNLNKQHLSKNVETIYEQLNKNQKHSASINGLIYRGNQEHALNIPKLASTFKLLPENLVVNGPTLLSMGSLSQFNPENKKHNNMWQGMGFNDPFAANELQYLIKNDKLPSFTLTYFPDLDQRVHKNGPMDLKGIKKVDQHLQSVLNTYDSWDEAVQQATWVVFGDSGQTTIGNDRTKSLIQLKSLLGGYRISNFGGPIKNQDQIVLAVNERMSYIYLLDENIALPEIASQLKKDPRIGFIAWKEDNLNHVASEGSNQRLTFRPKGNLKDKYEQSWELRGDFSVLDLSINDQNEIKYGQYPDALARLFGALHSHQGRFVVVDAKPGYEFVGEHSPTHLGGAGHGSLHQQDSISPIIISGTDQRPKHNRVVDFKNWMLQLTK